MAMDELIARLEAATEGSVGLDKAIAKLIGTYSAPDRGDPFGGAPFYTTSLDAALTLVPQGWPWCVLHPAYKHEGQIGGTGMAAFKYMDGAAYGGIRNPIMSHMSYDYEGYGPTPAIALCIAALRARSAA